MDAGTAGGGAMDTRTVEGGPRTLGTREASTAGKNKNGRITAKNVGYGIGTIFNGFPVGFPPGGIVQPGETRKGSF